jgi:hypothetical protein
MSRTRGGIAWSKKCPSMFPTQQGWMTVDRPLATVAQAITSHLKIFVEGADLDRENPPPRPIPTAVCTERILVPISEIDSVEILSLLPLLQAIKKDFPKWNGLSGSLSILFQELGIDPRLKYNKFYSTSTAEIMAIYPWSGRSLFSLAGFHKCYLEHLLSFIFRF